MARSHRLRSAVIILIAVVSVAIQFVPVERMNRLGTGDPEPREVRWILRRACYDCHSTEVRWPIWAYVAPMSWQVVGDVDRARSVMNFSDWASYPPDQQTFFRTLISSATTTHRMPLWRYLTLHPDARLGRDDLAVLSAWSHGDSTAHR